MNLSVLVIGFSRGMDSMNFNKPNMMMIIIVKIPLKEKKRFVMESSSDGKKMLRNTWSSRCPR